MPDLERKPEPILDLKTYDWWDDGMVEVERGAGQFIVRREAVDIVTDMLKEPRFTRAQYCAIAAERDEAKSQRDFAYKRREEDLADRGKTITRLERSRKDLREENARLREEIGNHDKSVEGMTKALARLTAKARNQGWDV